MEYFFCLRQNLERLAITGDCNGNLATVGVVGNWGEWEVWDEGVYINPVPLNSLFNFF